MISKPNLPSGAEPDETVRPRNAPRFLVVEDERLNRRILRGILEEFGQVQTASNGQEGLEAFQAALKEGRPFDVVFMDVVMPRMGGHQAVESIRHLESVMGVDESRAVKVIFVTAVSDVKSASRAFFLGGALSYLTKPVDAEAIRRELTKLGLIP